ncbi:MliC family protein [Insolitispirillum peregrinum]|uniref:Membrane-bound lysozyme-inhibitor of c-type lysozyme n=1 Tax=Insolitispirillum peregrinum TaxID=80876 RepID=A0A1N7LTM6_9PROT|nr:MliC family protein [Insolitispirillum peregrinum]SIS77197.1 Membrane-bound lysozyme-inhibitor of c-type lysozyme [Insolitispirillum peregrinum]
MTIRFSSVVMSLVSAAVMAVGLSGCVMTGSRPTSTSTASTPVASPQGEEVAWVYACGDGTRFTARFEPAQVRVFLPGRSVLLSQTGNGEDAVRYTKQLDIGEAGLITKGNQAVLSLPGTPDRQCTGAKGPGPWELARLAGVSFRAVGHGPEWFLEMGQDSGVVFTSEATGGRTMFPWGRPEADGDKAVWNLRGHNEMLTVLLSKRPCQDETSGETFEASVTVLMGGKTFQGCGKTLGGN